jgi:precorrin-2 dehydrogenase/sirohydrochlorin ferrochelatase
MIPLVHDFTGKSILLFGGGPVAARRSRLFDREGEVVVISPEFAEREFGDARLIRAAPGPEEVRDWFEQVEPELVVAATDDGAVNDAVARVARDRDVLLNRADSKPEPGGVSVPATVRADPVVVSVSTGGHSPALSRYLRRELETVIEGAGEMARLTGDLRQELQERDLPQTKRREALRRVVDSEAVWKALDTSSKNPQHVARDMLSDEVGGFQ